MASSARAAVDVIVVNFNAGEALLGCIGAALAEPDTATLTLVDNASSDGSVEPVARRFGTDSRFRLIRNHDNPGFASAVNQAVRQMDVEASGDYLLVLNPDCELRAGALSMLRRALEAAPSAAMAGPLLQDGEGRPQRANLRRFPTPWLALVSLTGLWRLGPVWPLFRGVEWPQALPPEPTSCEAVSGACMLVRAGSFREVGGMDAAYGLHGEDLDLMYRLRQSGGHCLFVPGAIAVHLQGLSSRSRPLWVHWQKHRGMQRFYLKLQAPGYRRPLRWLLSPLVLAGIWLRFAVTLPLVLLRR
jgi:GT2 family glycosyltransferase